MVSLIQLNPRRRPRMEFPECGSGRESLASRWSVLWQRAAGTAASASLDQAIAQLRLLALEPLRPDLVFGRHGPQPLRRFTIEFVRSSAAAVRVILQRLFLSVHELITRKAGDGPSSGVCAGRENSAGCAERSTPGGVERVVREDVWDGAMNDVSQVVTAAIAVAFTAMLLITGQWFVDGRLAHDTVSMIAVATMRSP